MNLRTRYWLHRIDTRQAMAATCHPRLPLSQELLGQRSIASSARRILQASDQQPDLLGGHDIRKEATELLSQLENHLVCCDHQLDAADALPAASRRQIREALFAHHEREIENLSCRAATLAAVADRIEYAPAHVRDEESMQQRWLAPAEGVS